MRKYTGLVLRGALCGQHDLIAHIGEGETYLLLTVGVGVRGVEKCDAALIRRAQQLHGVVLAAALYGQAAHGGF